MTTIRVLLCFCLAALGACASTNKPLYDDPRDKWGDNPMENPDYMAQWAAFASPGEAHQALVANAGTWSVKGKMYMEPGAEAMPMDAVSTMKPILGGRYVLEDFQSEFMGDPFQGLLILGYDNLAQGYFSIWMDNMSTAPMLSKGSENEAGAIELKGTARDFVSPQGRPFRHVIEHTSPNAFHATMYDTMPDGTEWVVMEMDYTRQ